MANGTLNFLGKLVDPAAQLAQTGIQYAQNRNAYNDRMAAQKQAALTPGLSPEEQALAMGQNINVNFPQKEMEWAQKETMTPFQRTMSNIALAGSIPGQVQQVLPGLLPAIKNYGGAPGRGLASLFEPDTSYLDDMANRERERFRNEVVPQIREQYGHQRGSDVENAIARSERELEDRLAQQRVQAYQQGLQQQQQASNNLLQYGMQPQFQYAQQEKQKEMSPYQEALAVRDPETGELVSFDKFVKKVGGGDKSKLGKQFSAAFEKATPEEGFYMNKVLSQYQSRKDIPNFVKTLKTGKEFENYYKMTNNEDPVIRGIAQKAEKALSSDGRKNMNILAKAVETQNSKAVDKLARRYGVNNPNAGSKVWNFVKGPVFWNKQDWKTKGPLVGGAALGAGLIASGNLPAGASLIASLFGGTQQPQGM